jgi:CheY-like chemotaxis protein
MSSSKRQVTALVVEDTEELAEVLTATLRRLNYTTEYATHGQKAMDRYRALMPDVVLLDLALPDMTGWKVLEGIKATPRSDGGKLPAVIVITAYNDPANRVVGKLQGIFHYLVKPFTPDDVESIVAQAVGERS